MQIKLENILDFDSLLVFILQFSLPKWFETCEKKAYSADLKKYVPFKTSNCILYNEYGQASKTFLKTQLF